MPVPTSVSSPLRVLVIALSLLLIAVPAAAQEAEVDKEYALSRYHVDLVLQPDGALQVTETIRLDVQKGSFTFMYREVDGDRLDALRNASVESPDVPIRSVDVDEDGNDLEIRWTFPERRGAATFVLRYTATGALRADDDVNILKWTAVGTEWDVPIRDVRATVSLPAAWDLSGERDRLFTVPDTGTLTHTAAGWTATFQRESLDPGQGYSVEVTFPKRLDAPERVTPDDILAALFLFILVFGGFGIARFRFGPRVPDVSSLPTSPPTSLPEAARLLGDSRAARMHHALLFDLAHRGHISFSVDEDDSWLRSGSPTVHLNVHPDRMDLNAFEREYVDALAEVNTLEDLSSASQSLRKKQRTEIRKRLVNRGLLYDRSGDVNRFGGISAAGLGGMLGAAFASGVLSRPGALMIGGVFLGLMLGALLFLTPRFAHTEAGARTKKEIEAYLERLRQEMERLRDDDPEAAARRLPEVLPWLLLSDRVNASWYKKTAKALDDAGVDALVPTWLRHSDDEAASFAVLYTSVVHSSTATGGAAGGAAVAGAGGGGAGGGGGGAG